MSKNRYVRPAALVTMAGFVALAGCAQRPASLDTAQAAIQSARTDPDVSTYARSRSRCGANPVGEREQGLGGWRGSRRGRASRRCSRPNRSRSPGARRSAQERRPRSPISAISARKSCGRRPSSRCRRCSSNWPACRRARPTAESLLTVGDVLFDTGKATLQPGAGRRDRAPRHLPARQSGRERCASKVIPTAPARPRPTWSSRSAGPTPLPTRWPLPASRASRVGGRRLRARLRRSQPTPRRPAGSRTAASRW